VCSSCEGGVSQGAVVGLGLPTGLEGGGQGGCLGQEGLQEPTGGKGQAALTATHLCTAQCRWPTRGMS